MTLADAGVDKNLASGQLRPLTYVSRKQADVRWVSATFLASFNRLWEQRGDEILHRCADEHPELCMMAMVKLAQVQRIELGQPGDFSNVNSKAEVLAKLEEKSGPQARKLFEQFIRKMQRMSEPVEAEVIEP